MTSTTDLSDSVQDLAVDVGRRIIVLDARCAVVAYSIHETPADRQRLSWVLAHSDSWPTPPLESGLSRQHVDGIGDVLFVALNDTRQIVGYLLIALGDGEVTGRTLRRLRAAATRFAPFVSLRQLYAERDRRHAGQLIAQLVGDDREASVRAAGELLDEGLIGRASRYCAVALGAATPGKSDATTLLAVEATLSYVARSSTATVVGGQLRGGLGILVFPRPVVRDRLELILSASELKGVSAGIGPVVSSLEEAAFSFDRANCALRVLTRAPSGHRVQRWDDLGIDRLLVRLPLDDLEPHDLPAPLQALLAASNAGLMVETLEAYLTAGCDALETAKRLSIHRSTLYYRLDKIKSVLQCDLSDGIVRRDLHTGLLVARLAGWI